jgi:hypothetical protein
MPTRSWPPTLRRGPSSTSHPYPLQIALRAETFIVGATFYYAFADVALGDYFREVPTFYERLRSLFLSKGVTAEGWETNWKAFEAYVNAFPSPIVQNALLTAIAHWDTYVSKLAAFVRFGRTFVPSAPISRRQEKALKRVSFLSVPEQIDTLTQASGITFPIQSAAVASLHEMSLVRNLGMHNEWIVDSTYLAHTSSTRWLLGSLRAVAIAELEEWRRCLSSVIAATSMTIAVKYVSAPDFPPEPDPGSA